MSDSKATEITCKNCGHIFQGEYCNKCGHRVLGRFGGSFLLQRLREDLFDMDRGLLLTFRELWTHPGTMVLNYIAGIGTKRYYSPLKYLVFWSAATLILISFDHAASNISIRDLVFNAHRSFSRESLDDFFACWTQLMFSYTNFYFLGLIPLMSLTSYWLHPKSKFNLAEIVILNTYFCGLLCSAGVIGGLLGLLFSQISFGGMEVFGAVFIILGCTYILYVFFKMQKDFFQENWAMTIVKGIGVFYGGMLIYLAVLLVLFNVIKLFLR